MCGIVGFFGKSDEVLDTLVTGLKRLEYRGYDSSGIAVSFSKDEVFSVKSIGKIKSLEEKIATEILPDFGTMGIAHTRWATHGKPTENNAHPHRSQDGKIWLVHNGIIENFQELKAKIIALGISLYGDTDTEILANLISLEYQKTSGDLKLALIESLKQVTGTYALVLFSADNPKRLLATKFSAPLVLGVGENSLIIASDVSAILQKTREVIYLEDKEILDIQNGEFNIEDELNMVKSKQVTTIDWDEESANKLGFKHFLLKEISEQPRTILDSTRGRLILDTGNIKFGGLIDVSDRLTDIKNIVLLGMGTSYYVCKLAEMYFEELTGISTKAEISSEFRYKNSHLDKHTWVIACSQSGETADTIAAIEEAKSKGSLVTGIVNVVGSTISRITDAGIYNHIGPEISVASTKAFTSQSIIMLMQAILIGRMNNLSISVAKDLIEKIQNLDKVLEKVVAKSDDIREVAKHYIGYDHLMYLGRKFNYPIALEGALKIKEISYIHAEGLSGGELKHGFIALIDENFPTIAIATKNSVYDKMISNLQEIKARNGRVLAVATEGDKLINQTADEVIFVPDAGSEFLQPIVNSIALQLFAYHCSDLKGLDVDKPRNLAKSVTVE